MTWAPPQFHVVKPRYIGSTNNCNQWLLDDFRLHFFTFDFLKCQIKWRAREGKGMVPGYQGSTPSISELSKLKKAWEESMVMFTHFFHKMWLKKPAPYCSFLWSRASLSCFVVFLRSLHSSKKTAGLLDYMGVSKNRGTPKWMVYNGNPEIPIKMDDLGVPLFLETPI